MAEAARLFGVPLGVDYPAALVAGLAQRLPADDPTAWARCTIYVNSGRMLRRVRAIFDSGPARLLPRLRLVTDLAEAAGFPDLPPALSPLELRLDLAELLFTLIERNPDVAPRAAVFDLADGLAALIDEMQGEGVDAETISALDVGDFAEHWQRSRTIVEAVFDHLARSGDNLPGAEAQRRRIVEALAARWQAAPPPGPVVIAGSTGSRGATRRLMEAVARLPEGYVVLPGFDFDQPLPVWQALDHAAQAEDHPQFRFATLMARLGLTADDVMPWTSAAPAAPDRNRLISLALRPAPVTDQWRNEGLRLTGLDVATARMTLLQAPDQRAEAGAIALRLRRAVEDGQSAALITPDRMLTRRVAAALQRWDIEPDDSAGEPLHQSAPGRFLRHVAGMLEAPPELPALLTLLKHPLCASTEALRGPHLRWTRELELHLRRKGCAQPDGATLRDWATGAQDERVEWVGWLATLMDSVARPPARALGGHVAVHRALAERLAAGHDAAGTGKLWDGRSGEAAQQAMDGLAAAGSRGGELTARDYANLLRTHLSGLSVLDPLRPHPGVMVWGTLEARVGGADLTILAGLNDGVWPDLPAPDAWLNRPMRRAAGLLSPERRIGLAAHDFQQAIAAPEVMLTRAMRGDEAETVPSRWLNRLVNLMRGLGEPGETAYSEMAGRGRVLLDLVAEMDRPAARVPAAPRPSPSPPVIARPSQLSVTAVTTLIRDPYAIYARDILRLRPLDPLAPEADARLRGTVLHEIMETFIADRATWLGNPAAARDRLDTIARDRLAHRVPQVAMRALWHARLMGVADRLIEGEAGRLAAGEPALTEDKGRLALAALDFTLIARPDRIDRLSGGGYAIYDYKSGRVPSPDEVLHFEKQLPLEAAMLERDAFTGLAPGPVDRLGYIALGASGQDRTLDPQTDDGRLADITLDGLARLIGRYRSRRQGYTSIRAAQLTSYAGDYDHLARYGEWDLTDTATHVRVGPEDAA